jgi:integrase
MKAEVIHAAVVSVENDDISPVTRLKILKLIHRVLEMAIEEGHLDRNPAAGLRVHAPPKQQRVLTATEAQMLLQEAQAYNHSHYPLWAFALMSGMRSGEMYALRWTDVDLEAGTIHVTKAWTNKSGLSLPKKNKCRVVPISGQFKKFLLELKMATSGFERTLLDLATKCMVTHKDYVLPSLQEWALGNQAEILRKFCDQVGITSVKFHDLRATFITNLLANNVPLVKVMAIVGHSKMSTTDIYLRLAGVNVKGATEALSYKVPDLVETADVIRFRPKNGG